MATTSVTRVNMPNSDCSFHVAKLV